MRKTKKLRLAIYIRVACKETSTDNYCIESQKKCIEQFLKSFNNIESKKYYIDNGYSGLNYNRPGFKRMIKDIKLQKINTIIVMNVSRIARKNDVVNKILELHDKYNIDFISVNDNLDTINRSYTFELLSCFYNCLKNEDMIKRERLRRITINMNREQRIRRKIVDIKSND